MTDLHTDVERYLRYLSVERQLSPITLLNYQRQLEAIINFASENGLQSWQQCDVTMVRNFAVRSRRKGLGAASLALRLSALRSFFDWLVSQNELKANPAKGVSAPKAPRHLPKNIDVDDMNRLLDIDIGTEQIEDFCPHMARHTYTSLAYSAGADIKAVSEILGHASTSVTLDTYTHLTEEKKKQQEAVMQTVRIS